MKKLFTFIFAAALGIGSCWGTEVTVPSTTSATTTEFPFGYRAYGSICQQLYLASELGGATNAGNIKSISFKYNASGNTSQNVTLYITTTSSNILSGFIAPGNSQFSGTYTMTKSDWNTFDNLSFTWDGKSNVVVTIIDSDANTRASNPMFSTSFSGYNTGSNRGYYVQYDAYTTNIPTGNNIVGVSGTSSQTIAQAKFLFEASETPHTHDNLTFTKWTETSSLPTTAGNYFLESNVTVSSTWTVSNAINLCLNGKNIDLGNNNINVSGALNIYDCVGTGKITSTKNAMFEGTLKVNGGTVGLYAGSIENTASGDYAYSIYQNGTLKLGGSANISSQKANIQLGTSKVITIESGLQQPSSPISVYSSSGTLTSGWGDNMGDANPADYFVSAVVGKSVAKNASGELVLASGITIDETNPSNPIQHGTTANVTLNRTLVADGYYSTIYLPFAVTAEQIADQFGTGTVVQELTEASLSDNNNELTLNFSTVTAMVAGKPYLIKPTIGKSSYTFNNVTLDNTDNRFTSTNLDFIGTFDQINLTVGNKNTLLLGAENGLGWAQSSGTFKGLRAYFLVKYNSGASAPERLSTRMIFDNTTKTQEIQNNSTPMSDVHKLVNNGQLIIIRNGVKYNAQGARL